MPGGHRSTPIAAAAGTFFQKAGGLQGRALRRGRIKTRDCHSKRGLWTMSRADSGNEKRTSKPNTWVSFLLFVGFSGEGAGTGARRGFGALPNGARPIALTGACGLAPAFLRLRRKGKTVERCSTPRKLFEKSLTKNFYSAPRRLPQHQGLFMLPCVGVPGGQARAVGVAGFYKVRPIGA